MTDAHNVPLSNAAELGLLGVALWFAILIAAIVIPAARRGPPPIEPYRLGLIAIATAWFVQANFTPFDYAFDNYVVWLLAGIVAGAAAVTRGRGATLAKAPPLPQAGPPGPGNSLSVRRLGRPFILPSSRPPAATSDVGPVPRTDFGVMSRHLQGSEDEANAADSLFPE